MRKNTFARSAVLGEINDLRSELAHLKAIGASKDRINKMGAKIASREYFLARMDVDQIRYKEAPQ